jgi:hypothetical protein
VLLDTRKPAIKFVRVVAEAELQASFPDLYRAKVPGGWLVTLMRNKSLCFYPDPHHTWLEEPKKVELPPPAEPIVTIKIEEPLPPKPAPAPKKAAKKKVTKKKAAKKAAPKKGL